MLSLFGKTKKPSKAPTIDGVLSKRQKRKKFLEKKFNNLVTEALKLNKDGYKQQAMDTFRQSKTIKAELGQVESMIANLETMKGSARTVKDNIEAHKAMKACSEELKFSLEQVDLNEIPLEMEAVQSGLGDAAALAKSVSTELYGSVEVYEDEDLQKELDDMCLEDIEGEFVGVNVPTASPDTAENLHVTKNTENNNNKETNQMAKMQALLFS